MKILFPLVALLVLINTSTAQKLDGFTPNSAAAQQQIETTFNQSIDSTSFKKHLQKLTAKPHVAGNPANEEVRDYMATVMDEAGWDVQLYPYDMYMSKEPGTSLIEVVTPIRQPLNQQEYVIGEDEFSANPDLWKGWNAYSGSGDVTAEIVYANFGRKEDFEQLKTMGIETQGKIIMARYGGNFRGFKAKFAEASGAAGLIIYTDPGDAGYAKGLVFPEGPYYSESTIQRGSVLTTDFTGDPLTPFEPALPLDGKQKVTRMPIEDAQLHTIPVTPIAYGAAKEILSRMQGQVVPNGWQGGLPFTYRLEGGKELTVRLKVDQKREFVRVNNVLGTLKGTDYPDEWVILGCHYDAWGYGATDPNSGTAMLLSLSETLGKLAAEGKRPKRSIMIGHWDAEEHGVLGSSEWVEQMRSELEAKAVAYLNFDGGVSGKRFGASAAPTLKRLIVEASKEVDYPYSDKTLFEQWKGEELDEPVIGNLGGGSDHIAFYMHAGVPSLSGGAGGPTAYHSNYDDFYYYSKFVDPAFKMGPTVESLVGIMSLRLANADLIPYDVVRYGTDLKIHFANATEKIKKYDVDFSGFMKVTDALTKLDVSAATLDLSLNELLNTTSFSKKQSKAINQQLLTLEKSFLEEKGMYFGAWYRSLYAASDPFSGYASWILPGLEYEIALASTTRLDEWDERYAAAIIRLTDKIDKLAASL
ncbi:MAG: N-acetylated-alpha-linked acidic dipeptidase [Cyclobacteriaceae bacterium]|jgi:N-acetylated-alpha-linked acidic dipeptidase